MKIVDLKGREIKESIPFTHKLGLYLTRYLPVQPFLKDITHNCKNWNTINRPEDIVKYIDTYRVDWKRAIKCKNSKTKQECARKFRSKNDFFQREIEVKISDYNIPYNFICPAESRIVAFQTVTKSKKFWIKGKNFNIVNLLQRPIYRLFEKGSLMIFRLAPQDYHRFYIPVDSEYLGGYKISGEYYSVNPILINSVDVYTENKREVHFFKSRYYGIIAYVIVGATCIGSIEIEQSIKRRHFYKKGTLFGKFGFGGSTIIILFQHRKADIHNYILHNSRNSIETYCKVGETIVKPLTIL